MLIEERQRQLLQILKAEGSGELDNLAGRLRVSSSTVRRDLESLESQGLIRRTHGGAIYLENGSTTGQQSIVLAERMKEAVAAKEAIGRAAAQLVQPHMTLLLDGGSTVLFAAREITVRPLQIVTNSLGIASIFADDEGVELVLIGGSLYPRSGVLVGPIATGSLADLHADLLFFSLAGIFDDAGFNQNLAMAQVEQVMLQQVAKSILLMDSSKFGRKSLTRVCGLSEVDQIITDAEIDPIWQDKLANQLHIAQ